MTTPTPLDRKSLTTAQRVAEYVCELQGRGIPVHKATIEGRKIVLDLQGGDVQAINPADLVDP